MKLVNIASNKRYIYLFLRNERGELEVKEIKDFFPYFFEPDPEGQYVALDGTRLKKIYVSEPKEVPNFRSQESYSSDVRYVNRYLIDKVDKIEKTKVKYFFLDIEVLAKEFPDINKAEHPISCITIYNSMVDDFKTWWLKDFPSEESMLKDFCNFIKLASPDLLLMWNSNFDYTYLHNRIQNFAQRISSIGLATYENSLFYPAGISVLDYLQLFKKVFLREASYALNYIASKYLGEEEWGEEDFGELNDTVREKNINDVKRMVKLERKFNLIPYYDEIRRLAKVRWEDLYYPSRIMEMLLFEEAKYKHIILPSKPKDKEHSSFMGATRQSLVTGVRYDIGAFDLTSAYPTVMKDFCLDIQNLSREQKPNSININGLYFVQNQDALIPRVVKRLLELKDRLKSIKDTSKENKIKYTAIKAVVNSSFGLTGNPYFRLYSPEIAQTITFLVRDVILYVKEKLEKEKKLEVVYFDTDSVFIDSKEDLSDLLNDYIRQWALQYGKKEVSLKFDYQGYFTKIFFAGKCHYYAYKFGSKEPEVKGMEIKRSNSSVFEAEFQKNLLEKILNGATEKEILRWIEMEKNRLRTLPLSSVAYPCKIGTRDYKVQTVFSRALENSKKFFNFDISKGDLFYYIYVKNLGKDRLNKTIDVLAFTKKTELDRGLVDWNEMINRSIISKAERIFEHMGWNVLSLKNRGQTILC